MLKNWGCCVIHTRRFTIYVGLLEEEPIEDYLYIAKKKLSFVRKRSVFEFYLPARMSR
jgi:hypothetical protein